MFSFMGTEIVATAAGESSQPEKAITIATNTVIYRILFFYLGSIFILTTVLSCLNSGLYTSSLMLFSMSQNGDAPKSFSKLNKKGVPVSAILACTVISYISVIFNYISPDKIFLFLVNASGGVALLVYLVI